MAQETSALLAVNADAHGPGDFLTAKMGETVAIGAGISAEGYVQIRKDMAELVGRVG